MRKKKQLVGACVLSFALVLGILPPDTAPVSRAATELNNPMIDSDDITTWDCVYFGNYWQNDTNGDGKADREDDKEPIKWRVLSVDGDDAFLLADQSLDAQAYNDDWVDVTWEMCTMRSWLNGYGADANVCEKDYTGDNFADNAFSADEQAAIRDMTVVNADNSEYGIEGGNDTTDKVYLLSLDEMLDSAYGLTPSDEAEYPASRRAKNTSYATTQGAYTSNSTDYAGNGYWWLRSPGDDSSMAAYVDEDGRVFREGDGVLSNSRAVRPALHLNLSSSVWSYAGKVASEGELANPESTPSVVPTIVPSKAPNITPTTTPSEAPAIAPSEAPAIEPKLAGVTGLRLTAKKKAIQVSWKKAAGAKGYQLWYSTSKKWKKKKTKTTKKTKLKLGKLKSKKTYYIRVRAYTIQKGKKVYGKWSKTAKKKMK